MNLKTLLAGLLGGIAVLNSCGDPLREEVHRAMEEIPQEVDYNFHVKPILSDRCYTCHGPDANARQADFRLDTEQGAFSALREGGHAFVGGKLAKSVAIQRINSQDPQFMMPPPESNLSLSDREIAIIAKWVEQGAEWKPHWSFIKPQKVNPPAAKDPQWVAHNAIDQFILKQLADAGLEPSPAAQKATLLRRISLDLTGLPPTVEELENFLADDSPQAYETAVDRLLASPHYGERMALEWLDLARYADTHGYQDDGMRTTWPWRDWVIKAYNDNMPYDRFLIWQLAGDLLPDPTEDQLLATCFNRNHPQTQEGGVVDEEYRVEYVADRTNTLGKALLGLTLECARCHDHKYDPFSQKEYYSLFAFFNNNHDTGIVPYNGEASPTLILPTPEAKKELAALKTGIDTLVDRMVSQRYKERLQQWLEDGEKKTGTVTRGLRASFNFDREWEIDNQTLSLKNEEPRIDRPVPKEKKKYRPNFAYQNQVKNQLDAKVWGDIDSRPLLVEGKSGKGLQFRGDAGIQLHQELDFDRHQPFSVSIWIKLLKEGEAGPIFNKTNGDFEGYRGWICKLNKDGTLSFQLNHVWPDNAIELITVKPIGVNKWTHIAMVYDGSSKASGLRIFLDGRTPEYNVLTDNLHKSLLHGVHGSNWMYFPVLLGMENQESILDLVMDDLKIYDRQLSAAEVQSLYSDDKLTLPEDPGELLEFYLLTGRDPEFNRTLQQLTQLRRKENLLMTDQLEVMIMKERPRERPTFVLERGAYDAPREQVEPGTPEVFPQMPSDYPKSRLGLARWMVHDEHPLTARVAVNRLWAICFGRGLVATQEDFGSQGNLPTHPDLLDWLAVDLMEKKWDIKAFLKQLVMSATYRQSSVVNPQSLESDPENLLYSYYPAQRLAAELIRDQALSASGLLVTTIGGPSVYPYQPEGIWEALATRNATVYKQQHGDSLYRRGMYTIWKRSSPPPAMMNFDAPDRYYCVVRRHHTSTPLQSLVMMNDPQFVEAARVLGQRILKEGGASAQEQVDFAFKALIGRPPRSDELQKMVNLYLEEQQAFSSDPARVRAWLSIGEYPIDKQLDKVLLATTTTVATTIMNFDEFVMKR